MNVTEFEFYPVTKKSLTRFLFAILIVLFCSPTEFIESRDNNNMVANEAAVEHQPPNMKVETGAANPPAVITVDTIEKNQAAANSTTNPSSGEPEKVFVQARTPKHANKIKEEEAKLIDQQKITPDRGEPKPEGGYQRPYGNNFQAPRPYEGRPLGGNGAFQPHEPRRQLPSHPNGHQDRSYYVRPPMQVSPGGTGNGDFQQRRNYGNYQARNPPHRMEGGYPPPHHHNGGYYEQRSYNEYGPGRAPYDAPRGQYPVSHPQQQPFNRYPEPRGNAQTWGPGNHPPPYPPQQGGGHFQRPPSATHDGAYSTEPHTGNSNFNRTVSTSFDRSVKSAKAVDGKISKDAPSHMQGELAPNASMASDDMSWKQLKQVHSVDDIAMRERVGGKPNDDNEKGERQPASNSSSLTNSPTEGPERLHAKHAQAVVEAVSNAVAKPSSLDSLSSVASAQPPIDTTKTGAPPSPGSMTASLDLMKCSSGSSGLLHLPPNQRSMENLLLESKRSRDEERGDVNTATGVMEVDEIRRAPSGELPQAKRARVQESKDEAAGEGKKKSSPSSITFSPSAPKQVPGKNHPKADYQASPQPMEGFYDKMPGYNYSMESAPSIPRDVSRKPSNYNTALPPRPGSSSSGSMPPGQMHLDGRDPTNAAVPSISSWEIQAQDSFGNGSVGGGQLASSFSFNEYPMLSASESNLGGVIDHGHMGPGGHPNVLHPPIESRNQSFEGGHYHGGGSFHRSDSMDYNGRVGPYQDGGYKQHGHTGSFPPHAPSWGTAGSGGSYHQHGPPSGHYGQYGGRGGYSSHGVMMRNYSQESGHRTSPPPPRGLPPPGHGHQGGFQPPPDFVAPHNPHLTRRPPPAVYIMSSSQNGQPAAKRGTGVFSWTKDDDLRLTEVMKKYKNPRDWEPIAKEHGAGKSAKECHERWIRYLKPGVRKGQWTDHEDAIVIEAVTTSSEQPFTRWSDLAQRLPGRVGKQIRDRWVNHLNPNINHLPFSREDDLLLWDGHKKLGKRWVEISTKFFHSSRSENHIKNRWYSASFKKFINNEFGPEAYASTKGGGKPKDEKSKKKVKTEDPTIKAL